MYKSIKETANKIMEKTPKIFIILLIIYACFCAFIMLCAILSRLLYPREPKPAIPEITYGEFPFELVYEIDGETVTVKDVYICEFNSFGLNRRWEGHIQGSGDKYIELLKDGVFTLYCSVGDAEYYMNDEEYTREEPLKPHVFLVESSIFEPRKPFRTQEEILEHYKIKIISWKFTDPIEDAYKK